MTNGKSESEDYSDIVSYANENWPDNCTNIAILCGEFSEHDGIGRVAYRQAESLSAEGYDVSAITLNNGIGRSTEFRVSEIRTPDSFILNRLFRAFPFDFRNINTIRQLSRMDVIIAHQYPMTLFAALARFLSDDVQYVLYNHGEPTRSAIINNLSQSLIEVGYNLSMHELGRLSFLNADDAISISQFARQRLLSQTGMDSSIIHNTIDGRFYEGINGTEIRNKHSIEPDTDVILFVGRIDPSKGLSYLIEAFDELSKEKNDCVLIIVGKPSYDDYYQKLQRMSSDSVIFTGFVPDEELPKYYATCDLYATASLWEGFNLPMAEAQACGKPVVAFDIGPHSELLTRGKLVEPENTVKFADAMDSYIS